MIKLNNKNITYVALADNNNSLKAPKEIWYADSNNSVKLVYRRKDALIEGDDYEKYHWLVGDSEAYIEGVNYNLWDNHIEVEIGKLSNSLGSMYISYPNFSIVFNVTGQAFQVIFRQNDSGYPHIADIYPYSSMPNNVTMDFYIENSLFYCNQNGVVKTNDPSQMAVESTWKSVTPQIYSAKMSYIREVLPDNTYRSNLIPCKLLKPVPKWLDANGIRRQAGECGMIDLISGKFYGNVNSVGTFTVENYYERKEWLVGDGSAYIDTGHNVNENLDWETEVICPDTTTGTHFFWYRPIAADSSTTMIARTNNSTYVGLRIANNSNQIYWQDISNQTVVKCDSNTIRINDVSYTVTKSYGLSQEFYLFNIKLEDGTPTPSTSNGVKCSYFNFFDTNKNYIQNLIPCTLTMDLPASMDANNIARTKGTSGMWDLVSDRFYGNVASSGTFKAVNLAEGVDYEVHDKLIVEDGRCILPLNSEVFECTIENLSNNNNVVILQASSRYTYHYKSNEDNTSSALTCWDLTQNTDVVGKYHLNNPSTFISDGTTFKCNGSNVTKYGFPPDSINIHSSHSFKISISAITVDGIERYIPVKLLKSIPSKYDANGIARQAGECGMYDTVNDVFYGNVASSGSFTVEDDN